MWLCSISLGLISCKIYENVKSFSKFFSPKGCDWDGKAEAGSLDHHPLVGRKNTAREQIETTTEISLLHTNRYYSTEITYSTIGHDYFTLQVTYYSVLPALLFACLALQIHLLSLQVFSSINDLTISAQHLVIVTNWRT